MRYNISVNNYIGYSEYRMGNKYRFIIDDFNMLTMLYMDDRPSIVLSEDPVIIDKFRRKVLKRVIEYAEVSNEHRPDGL